MMSDEYGTDVERDSALTDAYRDLADETSPLHLDARILDAAAQATHRPDASGFWRNAWFRPVAFAATFGLSLALILQLGDSGLIVPPAQETGLNGSYRAPGENPMRDAARPALRRRRPCLRPACPRPLRRAIGMPGSMRMTGAAKPSAPTPVAGGAASRTLSSKA